MREDSLIVLIWIKLCAVIKKQPFLQELSFSSLWINSIKEAINLKSEKQKDNKT